MDKLLVINPEQRSKLWYSLRYDLTEGKQDGDIEETKIISKITDDFSIDFQFVHDRTDDTVYIYTNGMMDTGIRIEDSEENVRPLELAIVTDINFLGIHDLDELNNGKNLPWIIYYLSDICYNLIFGNNKIKYGDIIPIDSKYWTQTNYRCAVVNPVNKGKIIRELDENTYVELLTLILMKSDEMRKSNNLLNLLIQADAILQLYGNKTYADRDSASTEFSRHITEILCDSME